jgi:hypothetical protein
MYRLVNSKGEPLGDWVADRKHLDAYLAERPDWCPKYRVQSNKELDGISVRLTDEDMKAVDDYMAKLIDAAAAPGMTLVINVNGKAQIVPSEEAWQYNGFDDLGSCVFGCPNCHGTDIVDGTQPGEYHCMGCGLNIDLGGIVLEEDDGDDITLEELEASLESEPMVPCFDGGQKFLVPKSEAEDFKRAEEFEKAADAAEKEQQ